MFACEHEGELLIKLPPERLDELKAAGAHDFEPMGRKMGGWVTTPEPDGDAVAVWTDLAEEAKAFVAEARLDAAPRPRRAGAARRSRSGRGRVLGVAGTAVAARVAPW